MFKNLSNFTLEKKLKSMIKNIENKQIPKILKEIGKEIAGGLPGSNGASSGLIQREMSKQNKSGRLYQTNIGIGGKRLKRPRPHRASTPDEFPAVISGKLRKNTGSRSGGRSRIYLQTENTSYATKMNARNKYLKRGAELARPRVRRIIRENIKLFR